LLYRVALSISLTLVRKVRKKALGRCRRYAKQKKEQKKNSNKKSGHAREDGFVRGKTQNELGKRKRLSIKRDT